ncbi:mitotic spindle assembly checkpoint protein MAD2A [Eurytemora carolleeae]|uniref:mitotic spindle assembly checkpoint protein MAD2A n=1 Tax=Eurytemora carolleeae TaxID=1294199 RepID=UPI000C75A120|nr:mitotic spindle assembly checkpoint protein MAD2A [Eurytemora carolleeae]|eukprot:XP_023320668.1 mitotic spindle assembly checkpoint protein MAD2A-like [Eurytemora affinis]
MTSVQQETKTSNAVTLKGSAKLVSEFFNFGINSILYQRGVYPAESFTRKQEYGLTLLVSTDPEVNKYLENILQQIKDWLEERKVKRLVLVLTNVSSKEVLERWEFKIEHETTTSADGTVKFIDETSKDEKTIKGEIRDVIRQITASVTFLPLIDCLCSFDILIYTHNDTEVPTEWADSDPCIIQNSEEVQLRTFSTNVHTVSAAVSYKTD